MSQSNLAEQIEYSPLQEAILEYVDISAQINRLDQAKKALREKIDMLMPMIPDGEREVEVRVDGHVAVRAYANTTTINAKKLMKVDKDIFWSLAHVPVTAARHVLPADVFREVTDINSDDVRLTIK